MGKIKSFLNAINLLYIEIFFWIIISILVLGCRHLSFYFKNEIIFIAAVSLFFIYFINIFFSFTYWKTSKGISVIRSIFFLHSCLTVMASLYWFLNWRFSGEMIDQSIKLLKFIIPTTILYFVIRGRKKKEFFIDILKPVFIRTIFLFLVSLFISFQFYWLK